MSKNIPESHIEEKNKFGIDLKPGDLHYRAYIGPPENYDLISAMVFNLLTCLGLRQQDKLLDIGCGSLRNGRLLIPYLNEGNYFGVEPNQWLVEEGVKNEVGGDLIKIKKVTFSYKDSLCEFDRNSLDLDFALAQSIFSHTGLDLFDKWLSEVSWHLKDTGALLATFLLGKEDFNGKGWVYPDCVKFKKETVSNLAEKYELKFKLLNWAHPLQKWAIFYKSEYDTSLIDNESITWNNVLHRHN